MSLRLLALLALIPLSAQADQFGIPEQPGFSGSVGVGVGYYKLQSNFFAGTRLSNLGSNHTDSLQGNAPTKTHTVSEFNADLRYTLEDQKTQLFIGNLVEDQVRLDWTQQMGIRHQIDGVGIVGASVLFSTIPAEVWDDPYQLQGRDRTERNSQGIRLSWADIGNSGFGINYSYRKIDVDDDHIGEELVEDGSITNAQREQLLRDGNNQHVELYGRWVVSGKHVFNPSVSFVNRDRDGEAEEGENIGLQMTYAYLEDDYTLTVSGYVGSRDYDHANPYYQEEADSTDVGMNAMLFIHNPWQLQNWDLRLAAVYTESQSDISFYDNKLYGANAMMIYRF